MATHSSILAWRIPGTGEPGGLPSMESQRVAHNYSNLACMHALEKEMATYSSILAWRIPGTEEPGRLQSMGSRRTTSLSLFTFHFHALEKEMAAHSSILAWRIPGTEEPGRLQAMGSQRIGYNLATKQQQQWLMVPKWNISVSTEVLLDNTNLVQSHSLWLMN